ncbi:MAG: hypothetical protein IKW98_06240 [Prevotella sp.]|nr:hypothetical protein [Prevotella sp.]
MNTIQHLLLATTLGMATIPASAGDVKLSTSKAVGQTITVAMDAGITASITWNDGTKEEFYSDATPKEFTIKSTDFTISSDENITSLYLPNDGLTSISVVGIRATLQKLYCPGNELTELDLNSATKLTTLDCQDNRLTSLRFGSKVVKSINCAGNQLTSTNLTGINELTSLVCSSNEINEVKNNASMAKLKVFIGQSNQLEQLDFTKSTSLKRLVASNNKLTSLTLQSAALAELMASYNQLDTLDITSARKLEVLIVSNNELNEILWDPSCSSTIKYAGLNDNTLFFNSLPTIYEPRQKVYTLEASITPQRPYKLTEDLNTNETYNWKQQLIYNGWDKVVQTDFAFVDSDGNQLVQGDDYSYSAGKVTFNKPFNNIKLTATSRYYPDITLTSEPFNVNSTSGIQNLDNHDNPSTTTIYSISGVRIDSQTLPKGIYIVNGKKVIIK